MEQYKLEVLKQYFGYDSFRDGQEYLIDNILNGIDVLGVMPTGAGKSICFQLSAIMMEGITLVISPLISLMKDQVTALTQLGIKAAYLNSSLTASQYNSALEKAKDYEYKIIYIAPERLLADDFLDFAQNTNISMVTIDEAHCISQWGQDFRPSYAKIVEFIEKLPKRPVVSAFTATATAIVREDILLSLKLSNPKVLVTGFDRKNLYFEVQKPYNKMEALLKFLKDKEYKTGIIYCSTRKAVEEVCEGLNKNGFNSTRYHAGLSDKERKQNQDDFTFDRFNIVVATNAFGMGIDKSNVSFVVHYNMPKNIESYYQEAGRAGRDGEPADCILLYSGRDVSVNMYLIENNNDAEYEDSEAEQIIKERDRERLKSMTFYCHTNDCLREYILKYFGESSADFCGNCGNCNENFKNIDITIDAQKILSCVYRVKERFGIKTVIDVLRGNRNERIRKFELNNLSTYGISTLSEKRVHDIINFLILNDFLFITNDKYPVLKLGSRSNEVLKQNINLEMKLSEQSEQIVNQREKSLILNTVNQNLFNILKQLRISMANKQNVPAFVIFSDSTLTDMCMKLPKTTEEMLKVSGVGRMKLEKYGDEFLKTILEFTQQNVEENTSETNDKVFGTNDIEVSEEAVTISIIADRINCYLLQNGYKKLSGAKINDWLVTQGYLKVINKYGANSKAPTEKALDIGVTTMEKIIKGRNCFVNVHGKESQKFIIESLEDILSYL